MSRTFKCGLCKNEKGIQEMVILFTLDPQTIDIMSGRTCRICYHKLRRIFGSASISSEEKQTLLTSWGIDLT